MSARDDERGIVNCQGPCQQGNWQIKRIISSTGPYTGTILSDAIRRPHSVTGETKLLWRADRDAAGCYIILSYFEFIFLANVLKEAGRKVIPTGLA